MNDMVEQFSKTGYAHYKQVIPMHSVKLVRDIGLSMKQHILDSDLLENPKNFGAPVYSRSIDMASRLNETLETMYASEWMVNIAKSLLNQDTIYLFNDQFVVKLPNEDFAFPAHTDNWFGPNPSAAEQGLYKTITCCWVLDDMTENNGPISILTNDTHEWITPLAATGDMLVWDGNTPHKSTLNTSENPRCVWLQIYASKNIAEMKNVNPHHPISSVDFSRFHSIKL